MSSGSDRHLSADSFEEFVRRGIPLEHPIPGEPQLRLFIDPKRQEIGLRSPTAAEESRTDTGLEHVQVRSVIRGAGRFQEVVVTAPRLFFDAYPVLCAVADRVQLQHLSLGAALSDTLRLLGRLLTKVDVFTTEKELGLFGELMFYLGLSRSMGTEAVLASWLGAEAEEHDFALLGHNVEVKTTASERRTHWIGSLTQLLPTDDRPLWLVSHQLTKAESTDGRTLPELISMTRDRAGGLSSTLDMKLHDAGWRDHYASGCRSRWRRRADSTPFAVVDGFPGLTPAKLHDVPLGRITDVRYRIDLTDQPIGAAVPDFLANALNHGEIA